MIENLRVKNVALIEEIEVGFGDGLNILTGETGAGKSIVIDSINFLLGERPGRDFIRNGSDMAVVEGLFYISDKTALEAIGRLVEIEDDRMMLVVRSMNSQGKSVCRINGRTVTVGMLKEISGMLVDVHGQHEHQSLLNPSKHIELLDMFCGGEMERLKGELAETLKNYRDTVKGIKRISGGTTDRASRIELLEYQLKEIEDAKLQENEEEQLDERRRVLNSAGKIVENTQQALTLLSGSDNTQKSASDGISRALILMREVAGLDASRQESVDMLEDISANLDELIRGLAHYGDSLEHDPEEIDEIELRLDLIYHLKRKYGGGIKDILGYYIKIKSELDFIVDSEGELERLNSEKRRLGNEVISVCKEMSVLRKDASARISEGIESALKDLGMKNARFEISIEKKNEFGAGGYDKVEFQISPNLGEPLKPLAKIASGGEMSRVMLAMKTILADADSIDTFIFDEIDTGVSGRAAQMVAEKLAFLGKKRQILCITHLPQIAAMGDRHFLIEKKSDVSKTTTSVHELDTDRITQELARLIGGARITDATLQAAGELSQMASNHKLNHKNM